jgi:hypothetical protein
MKTIKTLLLCLVYCYLINLTSSCSNEQFDAPATPEPPALNSEKELFSLSVMSVDPRAPSDITVTIDKQLGQISIFAPYDFDLTKIVVYPRVSASAKVEPQLGNVVDFRTPVKFKITAEDGSVNEFLATMSRRDQLPLQIKLIGNYGALYGETSDWDESFHVLGKNLLCFRTDENGNKIKNTITLRHSITNKQVVFQGHAVALTLNSGIRDNGIEFKIPIGFDIGSYTVSASAGAQTAQAEKSLYVDYPCPVIEEQPSSFKIGDVITIKGKFFLDVPPGNAAKPKVRLYKYSDLGEFYSGEFEIISHSATSITARTKGFNVPEAYLIAKPTYLQVMCMTKGFWIFSKEVTVSQ